jgi:hypothetical protein
MIVRLFKDQFAPLVRDGRKCQTVRPVPARAQDIPKRGELFSARRWTGLPYRSKQEVLRESIVTGVMPVRIHAGGAGARVHAWADWIDWSGEEVGEFAKADGFASFDEMRAWFEEVHRLPFEGMAIFWATPGQIAQLKKMRETGENWWVRMKGDTEYVFDWHATLNIYNPILSQAADWPQALNEVPAASFRGFK